MKTATIIDQVEAGQQGAFPLIAIDSNGSGLTVLFSGKCVGTVIVGCDENKDYAGWKIGEHWQYFKSCFKPKYWTILEKVLIDFQL